MKVFLFCMSLFVIVSVPETAKAILTNPLEYPVMFDPSGFSAVRRPSWAVQDSQFFLFKYQILQFNGIHRMPRDEGSRFTFDPALFTQATMAFGFDGNGALNTPFLHPEESYERISVELRLSGGDSFNDRRAMDRSLFYSETTEFFDAKSKKNEDFADLTIPVPVNDRSGIEDTGYDVIDLVPAPGAFLLGSFGLGMIGWLRRHRSL